MAGEWREATLGDIVKLKRGYDLPQQKRVNGKIPIVSSAGVSDYHNEATAKGPGVVTGRYGTLGKVFYITEDFWPLNTTLYVKDFKGNDPRFVSYLLQTLDFLSYSDKAAVPGLNRNHLHLAPIRYPEDVTEQRAIAYVLGTLDDKIELNRRMNETLEAIAQALFKSWLVDFEPVRDKIEGRVPNVPLSLADMFPDSFENSELGTIPSGWHVEPILACAELLSGGTPKTSREEYWGGDIPWASAKDVSQCDGAFLVETERSITEKGLEESSTQMIPALSTVVVARGATTGRMTLLGREMAMNQTCYALTSLTNTPFALYCQLRHEIDGLVHAAHGSVFDTITTTTFANSRIVLVPESIVELFEARIAPLFRRILVNIEESRTLSILRDTLLPKLTSGELRVANPEHIVGRDI